MKLFLISPVIFPYSLLEGIKPWTTGCKSDMLPQDYLPDYEFAVNITFNYVTLNTTYSFKGLAILLPGGLPVFINVYGVPFLSMLVFLIDLHKQLLFAAGKDPARSFSDI